MGPGGLTKEPRALRLTLTCPSQRETLGSHQVVVRLDARPGNGLAAAFASALTGRKNAMEWLWVLLGILYFALMVTLGVMTFRGGHYWLFGLGIFVPLLWVIGALIAPTEAAASKHAVAASSP